MGIYIEMDMENFIFGSCLSTLIVVYMKLVIFRKKKKETSYKNTDTYENTNIFNISYLYLKCFISYVYVMKYSRKII
jgi:hypothetical protein